MSFSSRLVKAVANYDDPNSLGSRLRARRIGPLLAMADEVFAQTGSVRIIDVGGTERYWGIVPPEFISTRNVSITIVNLPGMRMPEDHGPFAFREGDGCNLSAFESASFDIAHSNSVIEHVGPRDRMTLFSGEVRRVAPRYYVQTPSYWFPVEPHFMTPFFHWLPLSVRASLLRRVNLGQFQRAGTADEAYSAVSGVRLIGVREMAELFPDASIEEERILSLAKSLIAIKRGGGAGAA